MGVVRSHWESIILMSPMIDFFLSASLFGDITHTEDSV
ncbi:hypothetical protein D039_1254 [Vibrio parahaemolyticus EKP-028]|nr:hypothetical protein D039_1254 [Vibrio parahaemolyticus EKP-028]